MVLRGVLLAAAGVLAELALLTQSRASLIAVPVILALYFVVVPGRLRSALTLALLTVAVVSVTSVALNLVLNIILFRVMGFRGLALGTAIAAGFNALTLLLILRGRVGGLEGRRLAVASVKIAIAAAIMGVVAAQMGHALEGWFPGDSELTRLVRVFTAIGTAIVALVGAARLLRIEEFTEATNRVLRRIGPGRR